MRPTKLSLAALSNLNGVAATSISNINRQRRCVALGPCPQLSRKRISNYVMMHNAYIMQAPPTATRAKRSNRRQFLFLFRISHIPIQHYCISHEDCSAHHMRRHAQTRCEPCEEEFLLACIASSEQIKGRIHHASKSNTAQYPTQIT